MTTTTDEQRRLLDAIEAGETTDAGGMTDTQNVTDVTEYSYEQTEQKLRALERDGLVKSTRFGNEHVWRVTADGDDSPDGPTTDDEMFTTTRASSEI